VEPAGLASGVRAPLSGAPDLDPLVVGVAVGILLAVSGSVAGVWAQRQLVAVAGTGR
jgi:hydrogenase/urease accessory protein HupE